MLKPVLDKYNGKMKHSTTGMTPNEAHKDENSVEVKANSVMKEKYLRKYPNIKEGDEVRVFTKVVEIIPVAKRPEISGVKKFMK